MLHLFPAQLLAASILICSTISPSYLALASNVNAAITTLAGSALEIEATSAAGNQSLLWGTYRPQLYHGVRPRLPHSLMTGLSWFGLNDYRGHQEIRHSAEQSDGLSSYTYTQHDGRRYAAQNLVDGKNNVEMNVTFLKSEDGLEWAVRIEGDAINPAELSRTSLIYDLGLEGLGDLWIQSSTDRYGIDGDVILRGSSSDLGKFRIRVVDHPETRLGILGQSHEDFENIIGKTSYLGVQLLTGSVWRIKDLITASVTNNAQAIMPDYPDQSPPDPAYLFALQNKIQQNSNVYALQKNFAGSGVSGGKKWGFDVYFEQDRSEDEETEARWSFESLSGEITQESLAYEVRFSETFTLPSEFSSPEYTAFAQASTSNLIGGIGYFYGNSIVDRSFRHQHDEDEDDEDEDEDEDEDDVKQAVSGPTFEPERQLFTATPSRSFFPRGFYWDEGFHLAVIGDWDNDLTLDILKSWIDLIDENGWVGREQILGEEARSKVPAEFQTQYPSYANPPTLPMAVTAFISRLKKRQDAEILESQLGLVGQTVFTASSDDPSVKAPIQSQYLANREAAQTYLQSIYPALRRHYLWFRRTQRGQLKEWGRKATSRVEAYRWRGRTEEHVLTSGLDDYPRARPPHPGELHVDLMSWMGFFARTMAEVADYLEEGDDLAEYQRHERGILANLEDLHWSENDQTYCDLTVDEDDQSVPVCHKGYISLFPFFLQHIPSNSPHLGATLDLISNPSELWSPYGIRSLSASHPQYRQGEDYWKGPIWIQMNWLTLKALYEKYMREDGPYKAKAEQVYNELRKNVVENVFKEYQRTGYVWEQYDPETGEGRRSHPFTGWTSLVTLIMTERY